MRDIFQLYVDNVVMFDLTTKKKPKNKSSAHVYLTIDVSFTEYGSRKSNFFLLSILKNATRQ